MVLCLELLHVTDDTNHVLQPGGVANLCSLILQHIIVYHVVGNDPLPSKNRVHSVVKWWRDALVSTRIPIDT
jgi:hypothetical protein